LKGSRTRDADHPRNLTAILLRRGYSVPDLRQIWGGNLMRVFGEVLALAR
jgi:microsomal dipeptidase-like Zn-dependent dipeptidase